MNKKGSGETPTRHNAGHPLNRILISVLPATEIRPTGCAPITACDYCRAMAMRIASAGSIRCLPSSSAIEISTPFTLPL